MVLEERRMSDEATINRQVASQPDSSVDPVRVIPPSDPTKPRSPRLPPKPATGPGEAVIAVGTVFIALLLLQFVVVVIARLLGADL